MLNMILEKLISKERIENITSTLTTVKPVSVSGKCFQLIFSTLAPVSVAEQPVQTLQSAGDRDPQPQDQRPLPGDMSGGESSSGYSTPENI